MTKTSTLVYAVFLPYGLANAEYRVNADNVERRHGVLKRDYIYNFLCFYVYTHVLAFMCCLRLRVYADTENSMITRSLPPLLPRPCATICRSHQVAPSGRTNIFNPRKPNDNQLPHKTANAASISSSPESSST